MPGAAATTSERQWAAMAHVAALVLALLTSWFAGFAGMLGAGIVYLVKRDDSPFATAHAREAFNFNLSMFIYMLVAIGASQIPSTPPSSRPAVAAAPVMKPCQ